MGPSVATLLLLAAVTAASVDDELCDDGGVCSGRGLTQVPRHLPRDITTLDLSDNSIPRLTAQDLPTYAHLQVVHINDANLMLVTDDAFDKLTKLTYIDLSNNLLSYIRNTIFSKNTKLRTVVLNGNQLTLEPSEPILVSGSIESLKLAGCGVREISDASFSALPRLQDLDLNHNSILAISPGAFNSISLRSLGVVSLDQMEPVSAKICSDLPTIWLRAENYSPFSWCVKLNSRSGIASNPEPSTSSTSSAQLSTSTSSAQFSTSSTPSQFSSSTSSAQFSTSSTPAQFSSSTSSAQFSTSSTPAQFSASTSSAQLSASTSSAQISSSTSSAQFSSTQPPPDTALTLPFGKTELYIALGVSMLAGAGLTYFAIRLCKQLCKRRVADAPPKYEYVAPLYRRHAYQQVLKYDYAYQAPPEYQEIDVGRRPPLPPRPVPEAEYSHINP